MPFVVKKRDAIIVIAVSLSAAIADGLIAGFSMRTSTLLIGVTWGIFLYIRLKRHEGKKKN